MPRITVYIPPELKARMDAVGSKVNWSAIAQAAIANALDTGATGRRSQELRALARALNELARDVRRVDGRKNVDVPLPPLLLNIRDVIETYTKE